MEYVVLTGTHHGQRSGSTHRHSISISCLHSCVDGWREDGWREPVEGLCVCWNNVSSPTDMHVSCLRRTVSSHSFSPTTNVCIVEGTTRRCRQQTG